MIEAVVGIAIIVVLIFLIFKAIGSIFKGLLLLSLTLIIYHFFFPYFSSINTLLQPIGSFLKMPIDKLRSYLYGMDIISVSSHKNGLTIVIKNTGLLPLSDFGVKVNEKDVKISSDIKLLLPKQVGVLKVEWRGNYHKVEVFSKEARAIYFPPSEPAG